MIAGLGNPGKEYAGTRHNVGFEVIDMLADALGATVTRSRFGARFGEVQYHGRKVLLVKPWQYMNRSGQAVATAAGFYKLEISDILIVLDDMWLEPGRIRIRAGGSAGGHNGLADIIEKLGSEQVNRLRIGIGQSERQDSVAYVLGRPGKEDAELIGSAKARAKDAVLCWIEQGVDAAMTAYNSNVEQN
jgi:PTH1 family peptidyl-tRNA hydrolase